MEIIVVKVIERGRGVHIVLQVCACSLQVIKVSDIVR